MQKADITRLRHMLESAQEAIGFSAGKTRANLETDRLLVQGITRSIEVIGEAASQVSDETRRLLPEIPWAEIIAMRNRLIHAYFDINLDILWETVRNDLPPLIDTLGGVLGRKRHEG